MPKYTIGVDFGSLSGRAVLADAATGRELADAVMDYPHAVMDTVLAATGKRLPPDYALQDAADYALVLETVLPAVIKKAGVSPADVAGVGVDFTCSTVMPVTADGVPLSMLEKYRGDPHAYVKLWKHHAAQRYADRITEIARQRGEKWLPYYGGAVSGEWMYPKIWQVYDEAPDIYREAAYFAEAGDWINFLLTGKWTRGYVIAACKAQYEKGIGYPPEDFFAAMDEGLRHFVKEKMDAPVLPMGAPAGRVTKAAAARFGLCEGTVVSAAIPDAHAAGPALDMRKDGDMFGVLGTSGCFMLLSRKKAAVKGACGMIEDSIVPGFYGYEAGLCCLGDHFAYAAENLTSPAYVKEAEARGISMLKLLIEKAARKKPGESGVLALNWFNGNRSTLVDFDLSGLFVGMTLATRPEDLMRALIEATAFGARNIIENFEAHGVAVKRFVASGGIARKDPFTMQLYADVLGRDVLITGTAQAPALGAAIHAAVAADLYPDFDAAVSAMSNLSDTVYHPDPAATAVYDKLYAEYKILHDCYGRGGNDVMKRLRALSAKVKEQNDGTSA